LTGWPFSLFPRDNRNNWKRISICIYHSSCSFACTCAQLHRTLFFILYPISNLLTNPLDSIFQIHLKPNHFSLLSLFFSCVSFFFF
jgi:hypothetical protein